MKPSRVRQDDIFSTVLFNDAVKLLELYTFGDRWNEYGALVA
jgi:hypothetical protein